MDDILAGLLHSSPGFSSDSSGVDISASLEDARNLDHDFLPSDPSAEAVGDADAGARLAEEIEFLERMLLYFMEAALFDEPAEQQGAGDIGNGPEDPPDLMDVE